MQEGLNRRDFARALASSALGAYALHARGLRSLAAASAPSQPLTGGGAFLVGGRPVFLVSGSLDYFRCPAELWRDRLLKANRGGLNCIASCIMWNFHETAEGRFNFSGDHDLGRFIDLCGELGLYFYARVGPFLCDEWDGGGHPAWLIAEDDIQFRAFHEPTLRYVRRWFEHLLPILVRRQVTRGGPVILVQQENEYHFSNRPDGRDYQATLVRWMRELGIDATISDCNLSNARIPGSLQTINGYDMGKANQYQQERPGLPVMVSELYTGYLEAWGQPPVPAPPEPLHRQSMEMLSARVMYNYFMYHGGTNFGFSASSSWKTDETFVTTCYYPYGPLAEGGALNETYFAAKAADQLAAQFQEFFAQSAPTAAPLVVEGPVRASALRSPRGTMLFVLPKETSGNESARLVLPSGERLSWADPATRPIMAPFQFEAAPGFRIDWANSTLLAVAGSATKPCLVFRGHAGRPGLASVNGKAIQFGFGEQEPDWQTAAGARIAGLSHGLADRAWFADGRLVIGPAYVGERSGKRHECWLNPGETAVHLVEPDGQDRREIVNAPPAPTGQVVPQGWRSYVPPEIAGGGNGWRSMNGPKSLEQLGVFEGYAWYRASYPSDQARATTLQFTQAGDRFHVFLNGKRCGVWGRGANATRDPLPIELCAGENDFVFLCDNMGHSSEGRAKERKGVLGPVVLGSQRRALGSPERSVPEKAPSENFEFGTYRTFIPGKPLTRLAWTVEPAASERFLLTLRQVPQYAWVLANGRLVGEHGGDFSLVNGFSYKEFLLPADLPAGPVRLELVLYGPEMGDPEPHVHLFVHLEQPGLTKWRFKPWETPRAAGPPMSGGPVWWECEIPEPRLPGPIFLHPAGLSKGQVWLNGRAAGRYWEIGPQRTLYLPEPWWKEHNHLAIFDEHGRNPSDTFLARDPRVPTFKALL